MYAMHARRERSDMPSSENKKAWQAYVKQRLEESGRKQNELAELTDQVLTPTMVSNWVVGRSGAEPETAALFALATGRPVGEALRVAGHGRLAEIVAAQMAPEQDPRLTRLLKNPLLTEADRADFQELLHRRQNRLAVELVAMLSEMVKTRESEADNPS
jgi:hypothetical protein